MNYEEKYKKYKKKYANMKGGFFTTLFVIHSSEIYNNDNLVTDLAIEDGLNKRFYENAKFFLIADLQTLKQSQHELQTFITLNNKTPNTGFHLFKYKQPNCDISFDLKTKDKEEIMMFLYDNTTQKVKISNGDFLTFDNFVNDLIDNISNDQSITFDKKSVKLEQILGSTKNKDGNITVTHKLIPNKDKFEKINAHSREFAVSV